jgi:hypothetical protein
MQEGSSRRHLRYDPTSYRATSLDNNKLLENSTNAQLPHCARRNLTSRSPPTGVPTAYLCTSSAEDPNSDRCAVAFSPTLEMRKHDARDVINPPLGWTQRQHGQVTFRHDAGTRREEELHDRDDVSDKDVGLVFRSAGRLLGDCEVFGGMR